MPNQISNLFIFTKSERYGVLGLVLLILIVLGFRYSWNSFSETKSYDYTEFETQLAGLIAVQDSIEQSPKSFTNYSNKQTNYPSKKSNPTNFNKKDRYTIDPNNASVEDWRQLGFSPKQANVIINYKSKGAVFRKKEDLLKLFVIDEKKLADIQDYLVIKKVKSKKPSEVKFAENKEFVKPKTKYPKKVSIPLASININTADTTELKKIRGIGTFYAKSIVKYREMVGGINHADQYAEIYGIKKDPEAIDSLKKYVWIDETKLIKINVNTCTQKELAKHFYIKWNVAKAIISYREMHGDYKNVEDIGQSHLVTPELVSKIAPYLKLNDD